MIRRLAMFVAHLLHDCPSCACGVSETESRNAPRMARRRPGGGPEPVLLPMAKRWKR